MEHLRRLLDIMERLRDPQQGCPWDRSQGFESIVPHTLEEAYEVADAIQRGDYSGLRGELGDLLFQVVFYAQLGKEQGLFDFEQVAQSIADKLVRRHPHVFGDAVYEDAAQLREAWEQSKEQERKTGSEERAGALDGVARALPELTRAAKLQRRAARVGFDWDDIQEVFLKVEEELGEVHEALVEDHGQGRVEEEVGDLLAATVNLARHLGVDPETALRQANAKFERRFRTMEEHLDAEGRTPRDCGLAELDALWERAKVAEKARE